MDKVERILVVVPAQLGDVLLCTPLIRAAHERWPGVQVDVLGFGGTLGLLAGNPDVHECIPIDKSRGMRSQLRQAWRLWRRYDLAFITRASDRAHLYGTLAARRRSAVVPDANGGSRWKHWFAHERLAAQAGTHQVIEKMALLQPWQALPATLSVVPPAPAPLPPELQSQLASPRVVVHVPSMWRYKQWPAASFRRVVEALVGDGVQVLLTGSASGNDRQLVSEVADAGPPPQVIDLAGRLDLQQLRTLLEGVDAYLGPDTSVTHLAASLGVPIVTMYGPTPPDQFGPWPADHPSRGPWQHRAQRQQVGRIVMLQGPDLPGRTCVPCGRMGCEDRHDSASHCLQHLPPERALDELRAILSESGRATRG